MDTQLDNPVWWALTTEQAAFAQGSGQSRRYLPGILPFTGFAQPSAAASADIDPFWRPGESCLITAIQPGYYCPDTPRLGQYIGIRLEDRLIAMAGERMRLTGFSELSAIVTHPDHTGHGYAQQLIAVLCRRQISAGITPFLHVSLANQRAPALHPSRLPPSPRDRFPAHPENTITVRPSISYSGLTKPMSNWQKNCVSY